MADNDSSNINIFEKAVSNINDNPLSYLEVPTRFVGAAADKLYDNTIGQWTNTKDAFGVDEAALAADVLSTFIPGTAIVKGAKAFNNLRNVNKYNKVMDGISDYNKAKGTVNGHLAAYGQDVGAKRAARQFGQYTSEDKANGVPAPTELVFGDLTMPMSEHAAPRILDNLSMESPVPLWRGGDKDGIFFTPDKRIAKDYRRGGTLSDLVFNRNGMAMTKLPKGTKMTPGRYYDPLSPQRNISGYEAIVLPEWRK